MQSSYGPCDPPENLWTNTLAPLKSSGWQVLHLLYFGFPRECVVYIQYGMSRNWNLSMISTSKDAHSHPRLRSRLKGKRSTKYPVFLTQSLIVSGIIHWYTL